MSAEGSDDYPAVASINARWRVIESRDGIQWILQQRDGAEMARTGDWRARRYHRNAAALIISVRALCGEVEPAACKILAALPERMIAKQPVPA